jgi:hypothetical protein
VENQELLNKPTFMQISVKYSLILAIASIAISLLGFMSGTSTTSSVWGMLNYVVILACCLLAMRTRRNDELEGYISYGQALGIGTMVSLLGAILIAAYQLLYHKYIDPDFYERLLTETKRRLIERETPEEQIEITMTAMQKMKSPLFLFVSTALGIFFMGFIFSLITAIFVKKANPANTYTE